MFLCGIDNCRKEFSRRYHLKRHQTHVHLNDVQGMERCVLCAQLFNTCDELQQHHAQHHKPSRYFLLKDSAFKRNFVTYRYTFPPNQKDFPLAQKNLKRLIYRQILRETAEKLIAKISLIFIAEMVMTDGSGKNVAQVVIPFRANTFFGNGQNARAIERQIRTSFTEQQAHMDEFMRSGSNWQFSKAIAFDLEISAVKPLRGGCAFVDKTVMSSFTHLYSPSNTKKKCFLYCIAYFLIFGLVSKKNQILADHFKLRNKVKEFDTSNIRLPISILGIKRFLRQNKNLNLKINILYRTTKDEIFPFEYGLGSGINTVNLLLVETNKGAHYMLITNVDNFLKKRFPNKDGTLCFKKRFFCLNCLNSFHSKEAREKHIAMCILNKPKLEQMPKKEDSVIKFKHQERKHFLEYIAYLDFECVLPDSSSKCQSCHSLKCKCDAGSVKDINVQIPICYSFVVLGENSRIIHQKTHIGENAHLHFIKHLLKQEEDWITTLLQSRKEIEMTPRDNKLYNDSTKCYICEKPFQEKLVKVRDHSHYTGLFLGAACQQCNLRRRMPKRLKIFVHNCAKYDMHFIIKGISAFRDQIKNISVLPYNGENFRTLRFNSFEFVDTLAFLQASLSQLAHDLQETEHSYRILKQTQLVKNNKQFCSEKFNLVLGKSFFPYEYCTSLDKMLQTKKLPSIRHFYSSLSEKTIAKQDHSFAKKVWGKFRCKNLADYTKLYCEIDTILLAEIFQAFRERMFQFSGLDPAHYISLPAYGYDSMLLITNAEIELPTDINIVHFLEKCKRGGVSFINTRFLKEDTDGAICYLDMNNLYGFSQMQKLPIGGFRWLGNEEISVLNLNKNFDGEIGYFIECDLKYPEHLHELHSNLPLAPELLKIEYDNLSPYARRAIRKTEGVRRYRDVKLMSTFHDRKKYVLHIRNLQLYLSLGMELTKIHRVLEFRQDYLMVPYITRTTAERKKSTSKFDMDLFKKLVSCFVIFIYCYTLMKYKLYGYT